MKIKNLTDKTVDYLDAYCEAENGHTNWGFVHPSHLSFHKNALADNVEIDCCVVFFKHEDYVDPEIFNPDTGEAYE